MGQRNLVKPWWQTKNGSRECAYGERESRILGGNVCVRETKSCKKEWNDDVKENNRRNKEA